MDEQRTIVLVLRSGGDFALRDVELISRHINSKWKSEIKPRIICLWDKASQCYDLGKFELIPLKNEFKGTWARIQLYHPEMEQYKPFLYVDLDTIIVQSLENIFELVKDESKFITLEDFYQKGRLATGLVWFPKNCLKTKKIWGQWKGVIGNRMDYYIRKICTSDLYWQDITNTIYDFKPKRRSQLNEVPNESNLICFHGKPRIFEAANSIKWVKEYVQ
jgi:hypothetical protein